MTNGLLALYQSTVALHERFNTSQTVQQSLKMFTEEFNEVLNEVPSGNIDKLTDEIVDCLVTTIGVFISISKTPNKMGDFEVYQAVFFMTKYLNDIYLIYRKNSISYEQLETSINRVIAKNDAKTTETHELDKTTGKITRKIIN